MDSRVAGWLPLLSSVMMRHSESGSGMNWVCGITCISMPFTSPAGCKQAVQHGVIVWNVYTPVLTRRVHVEDLSA